LGARPITFTPHLTPAEMAQLMAEEQAHERRVDALEVAAEIAFANVAAAHSERFMADFHAGIARADALMADLDRTLVQS